MTPRHRRLVKTAVATLFVVLLAGVTYQGVSTALERRAFRHPGRLVDVGGHQLHIHCTGDGVPTVVLEAPAGGLSAGWALVQPRLATLTRVCSYDRSGLGWSEAGDAPFDPGDVAEQLHRLLQAADEPGPVVIAGAGLGAAFARLFASRFPGDTAALVLIDPPLADGAGPDAGTADLAPWLSRAGLRRIRGAGRADGEQLPADARGALRAFLNRPDHLTRTAREVERWSSVTAMAEAAALPEELPVQRVRLDGSGTVLALARRDAALTVTAAIGRAVEDWRHSHP